MDPIKLAIAEDHKVFRKGIILSLRPYTNLEFVMEAGNGQELIDQLPGVVTPQVVLMDLRMPQKDGIETTRYLTSHYPKMHVICLTMFDEQRFVTHMLEVGAGGYLLKNAEPSEINTAIMEVMKKGHYINPYTSNIILNNPGSYAPTNMTMPGKNLS